jgi:hypothetical protein
MNNSKGDTKCLANIKKYIINPEKIKLFIPSINFSYADNFKITPILPSAGGTAIPAFPRQGGRSFCSSLPLDG